MMVVFPGSDPMERARQLIRSGQSREAAVRLEEEARLFPQDARVYCLLSIAWWEAGNRERAFQCFVEAIRRRPDDPRVLYNYGTALARGGRLEEAAEALRSCLRLWPSYLRAAEQLALIGDESARRLEPLPAGPSGGDAPEPGWTPKRAKTSIPRRQPVPLATLIRQGPLAPEEALPILTSLAEAVASAHEAGAAYGGLAAEAILVEPSGRCQVPPAEAEGTPTAEDLRSLGRLGVALLAERPLPEPLPPPAELTGLLPRALPTSLREELAAAAHTDRNRPAPSARLLALHISLDRLWLRAVQPVLEDVGANGGSR